MNQNTAINELDDVLLFLLNNDELMYNAEQLSNNIKYLTEVQAAKIMIKLKNDDFVIEREIPLKEPKLVSIEGLARFSEMSYSISFEGKFFIEEGGYAQQHQDKRIKRRNTIIFNWAVGLGTLMAGLYGIFEIVRLLLKHFFQIDLLS